MRSLLKISINPNRIYGLDILRAFAIISVLFGHCFMYFPKNLESVARYLNFDGVSIFFVLSGFLIGTILIKQLETNKANFKTLWNFWIRRWMRTLPSYFLILIILLTLSVFFIEDFDAWAYRSYFYFSQNLFSHDLYFFPEAWSLSVEEWFYLLIPLILVFLVAVFRFPVGRAIIVTALGIIVMITVFRINRYHEIDVPTINHWDLYFRKQVFMRLDALMYGVLAAYLFRYFKTIWFKFRWIAFVLGMLMLITQRTVEFFEWNDFGLYQCAFSFSIISLGTVLILPLLSSIKVGKGRVFKAVTYISLISYPMYLLNLSLIKLWIIDAINWPESAPSPFLADVLPLTLFCVLTVLLSILMHKYFEIPMTNLRDRKFLKK